MSVLIKTRQWAPLHCTTVPLSGVGGSAVLATGRMDQNRSRASKYMRRPKSGPCQPTKYQLPLN